MIIETKFCIKSFSFSSCFYPFTIIYVYMLPKFDFKDFLESGETENYLDVLGDKLGIDPKHFGEAPMFGSFFRLGGVTYNLSAFQVTGINKGDDGKVKSVRMKWRHDPHNKARNKFIYKKTGEYVKVKDDSTTADSREFTVPVDAFIKVATQGLETPQGMGQAGLPPGMGI